MPNGQLHRAAETAGSAPRDHVMGFDADDWRFVDGHDAVLRVLRAQAVDSLGVFMAGLQKGCAATQLDVRQAGPILLVVVDEELHLRVGEEVAHASEAGDRHALGLRVESDVDDALRIHEADGDDVRPALFVHGGEAGDTGFASEGFEGRWEVHGRSVRREKGSGGNG